MSRERITEKDLQDMLLELNKLTGNPLQSYNAEKHEANIGNYHLDCAYGGYNVAQIVSTGGGITKPFGGGYHPKRVIYERLQGVLTGLRMAIKPANRPY